MMPCGHRQCAAGIGQRAGYQQLRRMLEETRTIWRLQLEKVSIYEIGTITLVSKCFTSFLQGLCVNVDACDLAFRVRSTVPLELSGRGLEKRTISTCRVKDLRIRVIRNCPFGEKLRNGGRCKIRSALLFARWRKVYESWPERSARFHWRKYVLLMRSGQLDVVLLFNSVITLTIESLQRLEGWSAGP